LDANVHMPQKRMREREGGGKDDQQSTTVQQLLKKLIYESQWERIPDVKHDTQFRRCNGRWAEKSPSEGIEIVEKNHYSRPKLERLREPEECTAFSNLSIAPCLSINSTLTVQNSLPTTAAILSFTQQAQNG